jgi:alkylated DNA repair protein alkB family protein 1
MVTQPTDFSDVVDIRSITSSANIAGIALQQLQCTLPPVLQMDQGAAGNSVQQQHQHNCQLPQHARAVQQDERTHIEEQQQQQQQQHGSSQVTILTFPSHPGLAVFPAALPVLLQLQLMRAALLEWPEPPTRTNHTAAYSMQLRGLFDAAQAGLSLEQQPGMQQCQQQQQQQLHQQEQQPMAGQTHAQQQQDEQQQQQQQDQQSCSGQATAAVIRDSSMSIASCSSCCCQSSTAPPPAAAAAQACICCCQQVWSAAGKGPKASMLLRKLRWASLGPPYNWSTRMYEPHMPHRQLPSELLQLAEYFAALTARVRGGISSSSSSGDGGDISSDSRATDTDSAAAAAAFKPNVALVNYYHPGDTLNGHKDDVERDLLQPIVTMSLGCAAVFLIGGPDRQQPPTPLLLRSGDVVVLGGPARGCYHGVPRVLDSWQGVTCDVTDSVSNSSTGSSSNSGVCGVGLQGALAREVGVLGEEYGAVLTHMQQCRVNISVRSSL